MISEKQFSNQIAKKLVGRKITAVRYLTEEEADDLGWDQKAVVLILDDIYLFPSIDEEGNGPGALFTNIPGFETIGRF